MKASKRMILAAAVLIGAVNGVLGKRAQEGQSRIPLYVTPFYSSDPLAISVGEYSKELLRADSKMIGAIAADLWKRRNTLRAEVMYVLAIRLFDLGQKEEAVYWYYAAQFRSKVFEPILDKTKVGQIGSEAFELPHAYHAFDVLLHNFIHAYAFRDLGTVEKSLLRVLEDYKLVPDYGAIYPNVSFVQEKKWTEQHNTIAKGLGEMIEFMRLYGDFLREQRKKDGLETVIPPMYLRGDHGELELVHAAEKGDIKRIEELVKKGANVDGIRKQGVTPFTTPLIRSLHAGNKTAYLKLLQLGANPNIIDLSKWAVIHVAASSNDVFWLEEALKHKGDPNLQIDEYPRTTPLVWAFRSKESKNVKRLIGAGADMHHKDAGDMTPAIHAITFPSYESLLIMLECGLDYKKDVWFGRTLVRELESRSGPFLLQAIGDQRPWFLKCVEFLRNKGVNFKMESAPVEK